MQDIMVDIETLSTGANACVLSIGAVAFNPYNQELGEQFYVALSDIDTQQRLGRRIDMDTLSWWVRQDEPARRVFEEDKVSTLEGLNLFKEFVERNGSIEKAKIWGNGAFFDNVILGELYKAFGLSQPWLYYNNRCYATVRKVLGRDLTISHTGVKHHALDDAITQAKHLQKVYEWAGIKD